MAVIVLDEGVRILEYEIKEGNSINFRVGWHCRGLHGTNRSCTLTADMFMDFDQANVRM